MGCFTIPLGAAIIGSVIRNKMPAHMKMSSLLLMLWGGSVMLVVDHAWNKEIVAYPPFLLSENLALDLLLGVAMTLAIFIVWGIMVYAGIARNKKIRASA